MAAPPVGYPPPGGFPPLFDLSGIEFSKQQFFVAMPWDNTLSAHDNIQKAEKAAQDRLASHNHVLFGQLTANPNAVSVDSRTRTSKKDGQDVKEVVSTYTLNCAAALRLFEGAFQRRDRRDPSGNNRTQLRTGLAGAKPQKFLTYAIRNAYGHLSEAALAAALKPHRIELLQFQRLKAAGINFYTAKDILILVRTSRWVPSEISVEGTSYKLGWIEPAAAPSYAAAAAVPPAYKIQARDAILVAQGHGLVPPKPSGISVDGQLGEAEEGELRERLVPCPLPFPRDMALPGSLRAMAQEAQKAAEQEVDTPTAVEAEEEEMAAEEPAQEVMEAQGSEIESGAPKDASELEEVAYESAEEELDAESMEAVEVVRPSSGMVTRLRSRSVPAAPSSVTSALATKPPKAPPKPVTGPSKPGISSASNPASPAQRVGGSAPTPQ